MPPRRAPEPLIFLAAALFWLVAWGGLCLTPAYAQSSDSGTLPADASSLYVSGRAFYDQGRFADAQSVLEQAVRLQPKSAAMRYWLGMTYYEQQQDEAAVKQFKEAIRLDRKAPEGYIGLGRAYMRIKNRMIDAREAFQEALRYNPSNADVYYYMGLSFMETSRRDPAAPLYVMQARKAFQQAAVNNPQHPDAYYQLARSYEDPSRDYETALSIFYRQLSVHPGHAEALSHFGRCCFLTGQYREGVDLLRQLVTLYGDAVPAYAHTLIAQLDASYLQSRKQYDEAGKVYDAFIASLRPEERALYMDLAYVAAEEEAAAYRRADEEKKRALWQAFWAVRDPDPATVVNERLVEHYRRVMHAREHFSRAQSPWDRRGDIYIRYGEPDDLQHFLVRTGEKSLVNYRPTGDARIDAIRERNYLLRYRLKVDTGGTAWGTELKRQIQDPAADERTLAQPRQDLATFLLRAGEETQALAFIAESWVYIEHDLELFFVDQLGMGKFDYPLGTHDTNIEEASIQDRFHPQRLAEDLVKKTPESYAFDYGGDRLDFLYDMVTYKSDGQDSTVVEVSYVVPTRQLGSVEDGQGLNTWLDGHVVLRDGAFRRVANTHARAGPIERPMRPLPRKKVGVDLHTALLTLHAPAGDFRSAVEVRDEATRRIGIFEQPYTVPDYRGDSLLLSDIKLAMAIRPSEASGPFVRNSLYIEPNPARLYQRSEPVHFYYEIYNLTRDARGRTAYRTELEVATKERRQNIVWRLLAGLGNLIRRSDTDQTVLMVFEDEGAETDAYRYTSIDTGSSPTGTYRMTLRVTDLLSGRSVSKTKEFVVTDDRSRAFDGEGANEQKGE